MMRRVSRWAIDNFRIKLDPVKYARDIGVAIGNDVRLGAIHRGTFGTEPYLVTIGDHVTIAAAVQFITHDGGVWVFREVDACIEKFGRIVIGNNVFIGYGVIILPNVNIGDNVVVGAGSVVTRSIPADSIAAGVPCHRIKSISDYRDAVYTGIETFEHREIKRLVSQMRRQAR